MPTIDEDLELLGKGLCSCLHGECEDTTQQLALTRIRAALAELTELRRMLDSQTFVLSDAAAWAELIQLREELSLACEHEDWRGWKLIPPDGVEHCRKHCMLICSECGFGLEAERSRQSGKGGA